jgi:hypothetical protein
MRKARGRWIAAVAASLVLASCGSGAASPDGRGPGETTQERSTSSTRGPNPTTAIGTRLPPTTTPDPSMSTPGTEPMTLCFIDYGYDGRVLDIRDAITGQTLASVGEGPIDLASWRERCGLP